MLDPILLKGIIKNFSWGMGPGSLVQTLGDPDASAGQFAELWFGAHPNGPAIASINGQNCSLADLLKSKGQEILGGKLYQQSGATLPFLFKILSVGQALSIQTHPSAELAPCLHARDPKNYPDRLPKPEVGIALNDVDLLYGFRKPGDVAQFLTGAKAVPEFAALLSTAEISSLQSSTQPAEKVIEQVYRHVMGADRELIEGLCKKLYQRIAASGPRFSEERWIQSLEQDYPAGDVGLFSFFLLNLVTVPAGKALFIAPRIPHAYLRNELAECMAPSDNVIRAGLTPKFIDRDTLLDILDYAPQSPNLQSPVASTDKSYYAFDLPGQDYFDIGFFAADLKDAAIKNDQEIEFLMVVRGSVQIAANGKVIELKPGQALLIPNQLKEYNISCASALVFRVRPKIL